MNDEINMDAMAELYSEEALKYLPSPQYMLTDAKGARYVIEKSGNAIPDWLVDLPDDTALEFINGTVRLLGDTSE